MALVLLPCSVRRCYVFPSQHFSCLQFLPAVCRCRSWRLPVPVPIVMASFRLGCQFVIPLALLSTLLALRSLLRLRLVFASVPVSWPAHLYSCFSSLMFVRTPNSDLLHGLSLELSVPLAALFPVCLRVLSWTSAGPSPFRPI